MEPTEETVDALAEELAGAVMLLATEGKRAHSPEGVSTWLLADPWPAEDVKGLVEGKPAPSAAARAKLDEALAALESARTKWRSFLDRLPSDEDPEMLCMAWGDLLDGAPPQEAIDAVAVWLAATLDGIAKEGRRKQREAGKPSAKLKDSPVVDPWPALEAKRLLEQRWKPTGPARTKLAEALVELKEALDSGVRLYQFYAASYTDITKRFRSLEQFLTPRPPPEQRPPSERGP